MILFLLLLFLLPELKGQTKNILELEYNVKQSLTLFDQTYKHSLQEFSDEQKEIVKTYATVGAITGLAAGIAISIIRVNRDSGNSVPSLESAALFLLPAVYGAIGLITGGAAEWLIGNFAAYNRK